MSIVPPLSRIEVDPPQAPVPTSLNVPPLFEALWLIGRWGLIQDISVPGSVGIGFSIALGLRLWRAINKSGRLDRRK
jgi:hypothetical protein